MPGRLPPALPLGVLGIGRDVVLGAFGCVGGAERAGWVEAMVVER